MNDAAPAIAMALNLFPLQFFEDILEITHFSVI
jgi:hypothetical protein